MGSQKLFMKFGFAAALTGVLVIGAASAFAGEGKGEGKAERKHNKTLAGPAATAGATTRPGGKGFSGEKKAGPFEWLRTTVISLNPTDDQKTKIKGFAEEARKKMQEWKTAHQTEIDALKAEVDAAKTANDKGKLKALREKGATLHASAPKITELFDKIRGVLTADQQKQWDAAVQTKKDETKGKFFEGPGMMDGPRGGKGGKGGGTETLSL